MNYLDGRVICSVAPESRSQWDGSVFETLTLNERGSIPVYAELQVPDDFSS